MLLIDAKLWERFVTGVSYDKRLPYRVVAVGHGHWYRAI